MRTALAIPLTVLACGACVGTLPPDGQIVVHFETDAPIPSRGAPRSTDAVAPLFDRLLIEVFEPGADAPIARRDFDANEEQFRNGEASFGIGPRYETSGYVVRARLYRRVATLDSMPTSDGALDVYAKLPPVPREGVVDVTIPLLVSDLGAPRGNREEPVTPRWGKPRRDLTSSWSGARRRACAERARGDEVCIPGGAFWMGRPQRPSSNGSQLRIVSLPPFYLDRTEVTVGAFRAAGLPPRRTSDGGRNPGTRDAIAMCVYSETPDARYDRLPLNCITWDLAREYCHTQGKELPTEAQLEYAQGGLRSARAVWGEEPATCDSAVHARGIIAYKETPVDCAHLGPGVQPPSSGTRDRLRLGDREVLDLAGNLSEWALDRYARNGAPCWPVGVMESPLCEQTPPGEHIAHAVKGGSWQSGREILEAATRRYLEDGLGAIDLGFRCARPAAAD